jgi:hypothetical protein
MTSGPQILPHAPEGEPQVKFGQKMIHRVEVGGDQVDWIRQAQTADVLQ